MIVDKAAAVLKKDFVSAVRYRNGLVLNIVAPLMQLATFYYLSRAVGSQFQPDGMPYFLFLLIGTGFYTFLLTGTHSFLRTIQEAQQSGTLEVLMTTSTRPTELLMLSAVSAFAGALIQFLIYVSAGMFVFVPNLIPNFSGVACVFVLSVLIASAIGIFAAGLQISLQKGSAVLWVLGAGSWLIAGTLFPVAALPRPVRLLSAIVPFTHSLAGMRLAVLNTLGSATLYREVVILLAFAVILVPASVCFFSWTVRRARQHGTLSFY